MRMIVFHGNEGGCGAGRVVLRRAMADGMIGGTLLAVLGGGGERSNGSRVLIPEEWTAAYAAPWIERYNSYLPAHGGTGSKSVKGDWLIISNAEYFSGLDPLELIRQLNGQVGDVVAINVNPLFESGSELVRMTSNGEVAGFRRFYDGVVFPREFPVQWPHYLLIRSSCLDKTAGGGRIPADFGELISACRSNGLVLKSIQVGGSLLDLRTEGDLVELLTREIDTNGRSKMERIAGGVAANARIVGNVVIGKDVVISEGALVVGPSLIGNRARIGDSAVVRACVVGENVSIQPNSRMQHRVLFEDDVNCSAIEAKQGEQFCVSLSIPAAERKSRFRTWPAFSYPVLGKRIADIAGSVLIMALLAPLFPIVAAAIKLTSRGPVFFRHRREGLHGKEFNCLKFRTMIVGSDDIEQKLRSRNQVDGPQFKMEKDPRITAVGRFLRDTFMDEVPQFINILRGDMSIVGPRPSPRAENVMCAPWRDCRLSVRPGVTGLWQVSRTRRPSRDFQEWIHYDTMYVRHLSIWLDLHLVWKTIVKLTRDFINQF